MLYLPLAFFPDHFTFICGTHCRLLIKLSGTGTITGKTKVMTMPDAIDERLQLLEEKFLYQEQTIDALNEVVLEQQHQLSTLLEEISRLKMMISTLDVDPPGGDEPPPPHY